MCPDGSTVLHAAEALSVLLHGWKGVGGDLFEILYLESSKLHGAAMWRALREANPLARIERQLLPHAIIQRDGSSLGPSSSLLPVLNVLQGLIEKWVEARMVVTSSATWLQRIGRLCENDEVEVAGKSLKVLTSTGTGIGALLKVFLVFYTGFESNPLLFLLWGAAADSASANEVMGNVPSLWNVLGRRLAISQKLSVRVDALMLLAALSVSPLPHSYHIPRTYTHASIPAHRHS